MSQFTYGFMYLQRDFATNCTLIELYVIWLGTTLILCCTVPRLYTCFFNFMLVCLASLKL